MSTMTHDVVIIGGGCVGTATALQLLKAAPGTDVVVVEPDPSYTAAASTRATGGVRQLFTRVENIQLSRYTLDVVENWTRFLAVDGEVPPLGWQGNGYLFVSSAELTETLEANYATQLAQGVEAEWLEADVLAERFPLLRTRDLGAGVFSSRDGWLDPSAFLQGMRRAALEHGARYLTDRVLSTTVIGRRATEVTLGSGTTLRAGSFVDAAGIGAPALAAQAGMPVPVEPMPRHEYYVDITVDMADFPFVKDPHGLAIRPEGEGLCVGLVDFEAAASEQLPEDRGYFEERVWPALVQRVPALDTLKLRSKWAGHYDQNRLDGNMIVGNRPGLLENFHLATGFSGHGLMHAPGVGRGLAELIIHGEYRTIDLERMGYARIETGTPYPELGIR